MSREAMQQALEALEALKWRGLPSFVKDATTALRQALAEPEQEPVAWYFVRDLDKGISFAPDRDPEKPWQPLYTAPTQAIEPVAWMVYTESGASAYVTDSPNDLIGAYRALPLYTAPTPRRPLTNLEIWKCLPPDPDELAFARAVIAAYEVKNGITGDGA